MQDDEIILSGKKLKLSEFFLGIFVAIILSVVVELVSKKINTISTIALIWIIIICFLLLYFSFIIYQRIVGYPDLIVYNCNFIKMNNFRWDEFYSNFNRSLIHNLKEKKCTGISLFCYLWQRLGEKILKRKASHISRTRLSFFKRGWIFIYHKKNNSENEKRIEFIIVIPFFSDVHKKVIESIKGMILDMKRMRIIDETTTLGKPSYYLISAFYPFKKKGKAIQL